MYIHSRKEFEQLPIEEKLRMLDDFKARIIEERKSILDSAFYCEKCKTYHYKSDVKTTSRKETRNELTYTDAGYGDDDMYGDVTYIFVYNICPNCGNEKEKSRFYLSTKNEKSRWE